MHQFDLLQWLRDEVGFEEPVERRKRLFQKLARLHLKHGDDVARVVLTAWAQATEQAERDKVTHYFCRAVKYMLIKRGFWEEEGRFDAMSIQDILKAVGSRRKLPLFEGAVEDAPVSDAAPARPAPRSVGSQSSGQPGPAHGDSMADYIKKRYPNLATGK